MGTIISSRQIHQGKCRGDLWDAFLHGSVVNMVQSFKWSLVSCSMLRTHSARIHRPPCRTYANVLNDALSFRPLPIVGTKPQFPGIGPSLPFPPPEISRPGGLDQYFLILSTLVEFSCSSFLLTFSCLRQRKMYFGSSSSLCRGTRDSFLYSGRARGLKGSTHHFTTHVLKVTFCGS